MPGQTARLGRARIGRSACDPRGLKCPRYDDALRGVPSDALREVVVVE